ncbi:MAG: response regulator [Candidatus Paceibacterota bacterium]
MDGRLGILIVEDDLIQTKALETVLKSLNQVILGTARSGELAIELVVDLIPDIIFMDIALTKDMNGIVATQKINKISDAAIF